MSVPAWHAFRLSPLCAALALAACTSAKEPVDNLPRQIGADLEEPAAQGDRGAGERWTRDENGVARAAPQRRGGPQGRDRRARLADEEGGTMQGNPQRSRSGGNVNLREHRFPDNSGSIGLPDGWRTLSQSTVGGLAVEGPEGQSLALGLSTSVVTPNSMAVQTQRQLMQYGGQAPAFNMLVAPFTGPAQALHNLAQQMSQQSMRGGGPAFTIDRLQRLRAAQPWSPNGHAEVVTYGTSEQTRDGRRAHYQVMAVVEVVPISNDSFMLTFQQILRAPDATFQRDLPVLVAIANSWRTNDQVITQRSRDALQAQNDWFAGSQKAHRTVTEAFDGNNRNWEKNQRAQARTMDDGSEAMRGWRTVRDNRTGEERQVNLGHSTQIVDDLNRQDPGRYEEVPLRDQLDPNPRR